MIGDDPGRSYESESELALLSLCLRWPDTVDQLVLLDLDPKHFGTRSLRALWRGMVEDRQRGIGPDEATILERHELDIGPGKSFQSFSDLSSLVERIRRSPSRRDNLREYVDRIADERSRRLLGALGSLLVAMKDEGTPATEMQEAATRGIANALRRPGKGETLLRAGDLLEETLEHLLAVRRGEVEDTAIKTGLANLDRVLRIDRGHYVVLAGRPAMGKTLFAMTILRNVARAGRPTLLFSAEMGRKSLGYRLAKLTTRIAGTDDEFMSDVQDVTPHWNRIPFYVDIESRSLGEILAVARLAVHRQGISMIAIDYLQRLRLPRNHGESREQVVANASRELANLAVELNIPVLLLSQLSRKCESRDDKRPLMSDLRESGGIEQDADSIVMLYRDAVYNETTRKPRRAEAIIRKQRESTKTGTVTAFLELSPSGWFCDEL